MNPRAINLTSNVYIVDANAADRMNIEALLQGQGHNIYSFDSAEDFLKRHRHSGRGCLILDVCLPGLNGLQLQRRLKSEFCLVSLVFVARGAEISMSVQAIQEGAVDFLTKPVDARAFLSAVKEAIRLSHKSQTADERMRDLRARYTALTQRERTVLPLIVAGFANWNVAERLGISEITVKAHRGNIMRKMKADSLAALIQMAIKLNILVQEPTSFLDCVNPFVLTHNAL